MLARRIDLYHYLAERDAEARAIAEYKAMAESLGSSSETANALLVEGRYFMLTGRYEQAKASCRQALELALQSEDASAKVDSHCRLAEAYERCGEFESAAQHVAAARSLSIEAGDPALRLRVLYAWSRYLNMHKTGVELLAVSREMLELATQIGDRYYEATALQRDGHRAFLAVSSR